MTLPSEWCWLEGHPRVTEDRGANQRVSEAAKQDNVSILHAGTTAGDTGEFTASGGRLLTVVATGADLADARDTAYKAVETISIPNGHYRTDIAAKAINGEITIPGA